MNIDEVLKGLRAEREELDRVIGFLEKRTTLVPDPVPLPVEKMVPPARRLPVDGIWECRECTSSYKSSSALGLHQKKKHPKPFVQAPAPKVTLSKAKYQPKDQLLPCPYGCGRELTSHGMTIHVCRMHGQPSQKHDSTRRTELPPTGAVRCIDCGLGPYTMTELDEHLKTCAAYALANRGNGRH